MGLGRLDRMGCKDGRVGDQGVAKREAGAMGQEQGQSGAGVVQAGTALGRYTCISVC